MNADRIVAAASSLVLIGVIAYWLSYLHWTVSVAFVAFVLHMGSVR